MEFKKSPKYEFSRFYRSQTKSKFTWADKHFPINLVPKDFLPESIGLEFFKFSKTEDSFDSSFPLNFECLEVTKGSGFKGLRTFLR